MSKLALAAVIVVAVLAVGGFAAYKAMEKVEDDNTIHTQWDYKAGTSTNAGSGYKNVTYDICIKNIEKDDTKKADILASSVKLIGSDDCSYSVTSSTETSLITIFTKDGYTGMGNGVSVDMNKSKTFTVTFKIPSTVSVKSINLAQHLTSFERNDSLLV